MGVELREDLGSKLVPEITDQFDPLPSNEQVTQFFFSRTATSMSSDLINISTRLDGIGR